MVKPFKTIEELVEIMEAKGIKTDAETPIILMAESYYAVVNGYKDPFLDKIAMQRSARDIYLKGTTFSEIYSLFCFDRDLRQITFSAIIKAEAIMKSATVYAFCEAFPSQGSYLDRSSYVASKDMLLPKENKSNKAVLHNKNLTELLNIFTKKLSSNSNRPFIKHYMNKHGHVPLWVLSNDITMGNMAHFYQLLPRHVQNAACKTLGYVRRDPQLKRLTPQDLLRLYDVIVPFRNICAHDERLYCAKPGISGHVNYNVLVGQLKKVLPANDFETYLSGINQLYEHYQNKFTIADPMEILGDMGFVRAKDEQISS